MNVQLLEREIGRSIKAVVRDGSRQFAVRGILRFCDATCIRLEEPSGATQLIASETIVRISIEGATEGECDDRH